MGKGKLLFKGDKPNKKKKSKSKSKHHSKKEDESSSSTVVPPSSSSSPSGPSATAASTTKEPSSSSSSTLPTVRTGTGRITTSGTVVTGHDGTKFEKELANGDAILVTTANGTEELRVITMRLSNISLNLSSPFSVNLSTPTTFQYIRQPRNVTQELQRKQRQELETANEREQHAYDLYKSNTNHNNGSTSTSTTSEYVYREKTETGSYRIKKENVKTTKGGQVSRGELLELRAKKSTDKYCF